MKTAHRLWIRKAHRYLGLVAGVQLLLWTISGLYFSLNPIERVRGEDLVREPPTLTAMSSDLKPLSAVLADLPRLAPTTASVESIVLRPLLGRPVYELVGRQEGRRRYLLVDARTGRRLPPLTAQEAVQVAQADFVPSAPVKHVERLTAVAPDSEYRGRDLPAYRIAFDHPSNTRIYVSAERGLVTARRNDTWRAFDLLWMFHIMDYRGRDDFNHLLLQLFSGLGVVAVLSGFTLWATSTRWLRSKQKTAKPPVPL